MTRDEAALAHRCVWSATPPRCWSPRWPDRPRVNDEPVCGLPRQSGSTYCPSHQARVFRDTAGMAEAEAEAGLFGPSHRRRGTGDAALEFLAALKDLA